MRCAPPKASAPPEAASWLHCYMVEGFMPDWLAVLARLSASGSPCILVTVAETRGSVPREAGAKMVVTEEAAFGTIGGGQLEYQALHAAREMLAGGATAAQLRRFGLGPSLGQ